MGSKPKSAVYLAQEVYYVVRRMYYVYFLTLDFCFLLIGLGHLIGPYYVVLRTTTYGSRVIDFKVTDVPCF